MKEPPSTFTVGITETVSHLLPNWAQTRHCAVLDPVTDGRHGVLGEMQGTVQIAAGRDRMS